VLTTQRLSLPEVGGDAVAYTEPDFHSIAAALSALLDDSARRQTLADAALSRAREFTWAASAEAHMACYSRAVAQSQ
jgi:glycosyltransferase involved in cell wall biosynthesis